MSNRRSTTTGKAGQHSAQMARDNRVSAFGWSLLAGASGFVALIFAAGQHWVAALVATSVVAVAVAVAKTLLKSVGRQTRGAESERTVSTALEAAGCFRVINGAMLAGHGGDVDHLALHSNGVTTVETKTGGGRVRIENGKIVTGKKNVIRKDWIGQAKSASRAAQRALGVDVQPVICLPWMSNAAFVHDGVTICAPGQLPQVFRRQGGRLSAAEADRLARRIEH